MPLVNILRIFAFSLVLGHSNFNNTLFQWFFGFWGDWNGEENFSLSCELWVGTNRYLGRQG